jgi:hypothetical protein
MLIHTWHSLLNMEKYSKQWHQSDIDDEYNELLEADRLFHLWSEYADVSYTYSRAKWSGHDVNLPIAKKMYLVGLVYMVPKYSLRYLFYRRVGKKFGKTLHEVQNPSKRAKLEKIAARNDIPADHFVDTCNKLLRFWPLLK